jgi:DNA modification methylase
LPDGVKVEIKPAKGRPMLTWVGKRPLRQVTAFPAQLVETFTPNHGGASGTGGADHPWGVWPAAYPQGGLLFHGDNKEVLAHLLANGFRGKVKFIYIDPPFDSGADYVRKVALRGAKGTAKIEGEGYTLGEQIQYTDIWANDNYLQFMYERLLLLKELLDDQNGMISLQCDWRKGHHLRCLLDEVFGPENFRGEILIRAGTKNVQSQFKEVSILTTGNNVILLYSKSRDAKLLKLMDKLQGFKPGKWDTFWRGTDRPTLRYNLLGQTPSDGQWRWKKERAEKAIQNYQNYLDKFKDELSLDDYYISVSESEGVELDFVRKDESGTIQYYVSPRNYKLLSNVWFDLSYRGTRTDYPTEKHEEPIERLVEWLTKPNSLVLDCFIGSGTTSAVAQKFGRRWIGCDINKGAIQATSKRLQTIILEQLDAEKKRVKQLPLPSAGDEITEDSPTPAQSSFAVYRVNDYDLQIQHNEAVNLACEHIGITRTKADAFFDGTLGKKLVKVVPFGHPLTLLDLEEIKRELGARPEEDRDICVVCLGKETAADGWLEDWNRLRKQGDVPNKIEVIELRTDPRYGKFFVHQPATAKVSITREQGKVKVEIQDFISPTIIERLKQQSGLLTPQIDDWRAMVDSVMIDLAYNGEVFNVAFADVPPKKADLVAGQYDLDAPEDETTVAVKITDMLGEEVLITQKI